MNFCEFSILLLAFFIKNLHAVNYGSEEELAVDSPGSLSVGNNEVLRLAEIGMLKMNEGLDGEPRQLVKVVKATRQIVSGVLTHLTLNISDGDIYKLCQVKILEQPWLNKTEVTYSKCKQVEENPMKQHENEENQLKLALFNKFVTKYNKVYADGAEYSKRFHIFRANLKKIQFLRENEQGTAQYGLTYFADMSSTEFKKYLGLKVPEIQEEFPPAEIPDIKLPPEFDWRHYNVVTPVKNQGQCGSCWAFSVTGNIEGQWALKHKQLLSLSEQELVDCDKTDEGCEGGYMTNAYRAIMKLGGLETENDYPYEAEDEKCNFDKSEVKVTISGALNISSNETQMAQWLVKNGPMSVGLNAFAMQFYFGGVSHPSKYLCRPEDIDHGVLIVGYGVHNTSILKRTLPYWIIKNSWGKHWGERGYYRLYRGDGSCGINQMVSSAVVN